MQRRFLFLHIVLIVLHISSWFLPYAYDITPWTYLTKGAAESGEFARMVSVPMFVILLAVIDLFVKQESIIRAIMNGLLLILLGVAIFGYAASIWDHYLHDVETIIALLFSLVLFMYSFLIQKGTSFTRNVILCLMALPIISHMFDLSSQFQIGAWILNNSFFAWVLLAVIQPFQMPKQTDAGS